jgi:hypothetical protein
MCLSADAAIDVQVSAAADEGYIHVRIKHVTLRVLNKTRLKILPVLTPEIALFQNFNFFLQNC